MKLKYNCYSCGTEFTGSNCQKCGYGYKKSGCVDDFIGDYQPKVGSEKFAAFNRNLDANVFSRLLIDIGMDFFKDFSGNVLDAGCGTGYYSHRIFEKNNKASLTGLDIGTSFDASLCSERFGFVRADIFKAPFRPETFDAVVNFDVIEHIEEDRLFVGKMLELLKPGGKFLVGTPNLNRLTNIIYGLVKGKKKFPFDYGNDAVLGETIHVREYGRREIELLMEDFRDILDYKLIPVLFGIRTGKGIIGIKKPAGFLSPNCYYWYVAGTKK